MEEKKVKKPKGYKFKMNTSAHDLIWTRSWMLKILSVWPVVDRRYKLNCKCDCGKELQVYATNIVSGRSYSCWCIRVKPQMKGHPDFKPKKK